MKPRILFTALSLVIAVSVTAQESGGIGPVPVSKSVSGLPAPVDIACYLCPDESIFCNSPDLTNGGGTSDYQTCYTCFDNFHGLNATFNTVIFWGFELFNSGGQYYDCTPAEPKSFEVTIYEDNAGSIGNPVMTYTGLPTRSFCVQTQSYAAASLYRYKLTLPGDVDMSSGWISIRATGGYDNCWFIWTISLSDNLLLYQSCYSMIPYSLDLAFALMNEETPPEPEIPVSNWALILGLALILGFTAFRLRRA